ncbi:GNAT family N-acetyltransferase [Streptomyces sp. LX-29]|uniref:GNAT family N-acetyltransferase n=1 Tax=Streptomyces sp. LX-29 TaxID=2900152 RepID=UPI00240E3412|nr:GNAT family protein [Streptomyces sp. LX-29]WFB11186.1 GNAT family N-acetyltransferase [Streptomyces sp. LX-29]
MLSSPLTAGAELCSLEPWQAAEFATFIDRHRAHLAPWLPWATSITDVDGARHFLQRYADAQRNDEGRLFAIRLDGALIGGTVFRIFDVPSGVCELGVWIAPEAQGRGLVTAAARRMIDWAFGVRGMARVEWRAAPHNLRSNVVAERLGMTREGVLREVFPLHGERQDLAVWSLLASEWRTAAG